MSGSFTNDASRVKYQNTFSGVRMETLDIVCRLLGEFFGTSLLLLFACMGLIQWTQNEQPYFVGGLVFGLTIMFIIQVVGAVSGTIHLNKKKIRQIFSSFSNLGSHINPAVTLAALIYRRITIRVGEHSFVKLKYNLKQFFFKF